MSRRLMALKGDFLRASDATTPADRSTASAWCARPQSVHGRRPSRTRPVHGPHAAAGSDGFSYVGGDAGREPSQHKYVQEPGGLMHSNKCDHAMRPAKALTRWAPIGGFEFVGGETEWQLSQHKYVKTAARLVHSSECDHAIRAVRGPSAREVDATRRIYGGA